MLIEILNMLNSEIILRGAKGNRVTYKYRCIKIISDFSMGTLEGRRSCVDVLQILRDKRCQSKLLDLGNLSVTIKKTRYSMIKFCSNTMYNFSLTDDSRKKSPV